MPDTKKARIIVRNWKLAPITPTTIVEIDGKLYIDIGSARETVESYQNRPGNDLPPLKAWLWSRIEHLKIIRWVWHYNNLSCKPKIYYSSDLRTLLVEWVASWQTCQLLSIFPSWEIACNNASTDRKGRFLTTYDDFCVAAQAYTVGRYYDLQEVSEDKARAWLKEHPDEGVDIKELLKSNLATINVEEAELIKHRSEYKLFNFFKRAVNLFTRKQLST